MAGKQHTRNRIIEAALELFGEKGFAAASVREIAVRADRLLRPFGRH